MLASEDNEDWPVYGFDALQYSYFKNDSALTAVWYNFFNSGHCCYSFDSENIFRSLRKTSQHIIMDAFYCWL